MPRPGQAPTARPWKSPGGPTPRGSLPARPAAASQTKARTRHSASYPWAQRGWGWPGRHPDTRTGRQCGLWAPPTGPRQGASRQLKVQEPAPSPHHLTPGLVCCLLQAGRVDGLRRPPGAPSCQEGGPGREERRSTSESPAQPGSQSRGRRMSACLRLGGRWARGLSLPDQATRGCPPPGPPLWAQRRLAGLSARKWGVDKGVTVPRLPGGRVLVPHHKLSWPGGELSAHEPLG